MGWSGDAVRRGGTPWPPFEPGILSLADEQEQAVIGNAVARTGELAAGGNLTAAVCAFAGWPFDDEEITVAVVDHVPNARLHEIPGVGHAAPLTHPEALAEALTEFFTPAQQPA